jgi:hypothetical protein
LGELATEDSGRPKKASTERTLILGELIGSRARQRASDWRKQAALFDVDLDDAEDKANAEHGGARSRSTERTMILSDLIKPPPSSA